MSKISKSLQFGAVIIIVVLAMLLLGFIFGWVDADQFKEVAIKVVAAVAVVVLAAIAIMGLSKSQ